MDLVLFDVGGTLIDDPFEEVLATLRSESLENFCLLSLRKGDFSDLLCYWREENSKNDDQFASHFLQEEGWIIQSLLRLNLVKKVPPIEDVPFASLSLLRRYREIAQIQISQQPQLPLLRKTLAWLKRRGTVLCAASNDRDYATKAMLRWATIMCFFDNIFTSEGLSRRHRGTEKPRPNFFKAIFKELGQTINDYSHVVYIGDSEKNDILPTHAMGLCTVRYFNERNPQNAVWIDSATETVADYSYLDRRRLPRILREILVE